MIRDYNLTRSQPAKANNATTFVLQNPGLLFSRSCYVLVDLDLLNFLNSNLPFLIRFVHFHKFVLSFRFKIVVVRIKTLKIKPRREQDRVVIISDIQFGMCV